MDERIVVYVLRCADGSLYTGWTVDLERRLEQHRAARASKYTRARLPVELVARFSVADRTEARRLEARIKALSREEKLALVTAGEAEASGACRAGPEIPATRRRSP